MKTVLLGLALPFCVLTSYGQTPQENDFKKADLIKTNSTLYLKQGGQQDAPEFTTKAEKEAWWNNNKPVTANQILPNGDIVKDGEKNHRNIVIFENDSSFPVYKNTGNKDLDAQNYSQLKSELINQNQGKYNQMSQIPSGPVMSEKERRQSVSQPQN